MGKPGLSLSKAITIVGRWDIDYNHRPCNRLADEVGGRKKGAKSIEE